MGKKLHIILTRYGINQKELEENYVILSEIEKSLSNRYSYEVAMDITHSFRSLPFYNLVILNYISSISDIEINISNIICAVLPIELLQSLLNIADNRPVLVGKNERVATGKMTQMSDGKLEKEYVFKHGGWKQMISIKIETKDL